MENLIRYLRPSVAWVTGLTHSYRYNPFVRTKVNIILIQATVSLIMIGVFWLALHSSEAAIIAHITEGIGSSASAELLTETNEERDRTLLLVLLGLLLLTILKGYLLAGFALRPAKESLLSQKRFIGNVAHEIRTPLAVMKTTTEVALMDPTLTPAAREAHEETIRELDRMSEIINNLLTFDNLIRPERMVPVPVDLGQIAEKVVARHEDLAVSHGVSLTLSKSEETHVVMGNSTALEEVVSNLIKNAITYTLKDSQGVVSVDVARDFGERVAVTVTDSGIGISQKDLFHVFEPFYRTDTSRARISGGSGLGLAIVNEIVRMHKGTITIRSAIDHGTAIKVTFKAAAQTDPTPPPLPEAPSGSVSEVAVDFT